MRDRAFEPRRLDVEALARAGAALAGEVPLKDLPRLAEGVRDETAAVVTWSAAGAMRKPAGESTPVAMLHLQARARLAFQCQRCLQPLELPVAADTWFRFVAGEDEAERLDAEAEEDVLALTRSLDLHALLEDELLLALPLVPRHEQCPQPLPAHGGGTSADPAAAKPFAALAALRKRS